MLGLTYSRTPIDIATIGTWYKILAKDPLNKERAPSSLPILYIASNKCL